MSFLRGLVLSNKSMSPLTSMAAGRVLAHYALLPPQPVGMPAAFFQGQQGEQVYAFGDCINDVIPVNFEAIKEYAKKFYCIRYDNAMGPVDAPVTGCNGVYNLFRAGVYLSPEELGLLKHAGLEFAGLVSGFDSIYQSLVLTANPAL